MDVRFKPLYTPLAWVSEPWEARRDRAGAHCEQVQQALVEAGSGARPGGRDSGEGTEHDRLDGISDDGFHSALAGLDRECEPRQRCDGYSAHLFLKQDVRSASVIL